MKANIASILSKISRYVPLLDPKRLDDFVLEEGDVNDVKVTQGNVIITYNDSSSLLRMLTILYQLPLPVSFTLKRKMRHLSISLDVSRNALYKVSSLKKLLAQMAALGYTELYLYMEDVYEVVNHPAIGYMRGRYSIEELKEVVLFGRDLGLDVIPCIQTLGHFEQIFHYNYYKDIKDGIANLMVDHEKTYQLIESMLVSLRQAFSTSKIALGMDEVHSLGRGGRIDVFGYEAQPSQFIRHLNKVVDLCKKHGFDAPMIWSDMLIKMHAKSYTYRDTDVTLDPNIINQLPKDITLCYWDYDTTDKAFLEEMMQVHKRFSRKLMMASGLRAYFVSYYDHEHSNKNMQAMLDVTASNQIETHLLTIWKDDGAYCNPTSYLYGVERLAAMAYESTLTVALFTCVFGQKDAPMLTLGKLGQLNQAPTSLLFDDPLQGIYMNNEMQKNPTFFEDTIQGIQTLIEEVHSLPRDEFTEEALLYLTLIKDKTLLREKLITHYQSSSYHEALTLLPFVDALKQTLLQYEQAFRKTWLMTFKPYGLDVMQERFGYVYFRLEETKRVIKEWAITHEPIPFLEELKHLPPYIKIKPLFKNIGHGSVSR